MTDNTKALEALHEIVPGVFVERTRYGELYVGTEDGSLGVILHPSNDEVRCELLRRIAEAALAAPINPDAVDSKVVGATPQRGEAGRADTQYFAASITLPQAQALVEYFGGSNTEVLLYDFPAGRIVNDDESPCPAGLYAICAECPEEGATYLGDHDPDSECESTPPSADDRTPPAEHLDDAAVDAFAEQMKAKLAKARAKGRGGWEGPECTAEILSSMLRDHVAKGDPVDVANFCMFLSQRGEGIAQPAVAESAQGERGAVADEMTAWASAKMTGPQSSRIDRTMVLEWAKRLRGEQPDANEDAYVIEQLGRLLAEISVIVNGPEPANGRWSYHDLPAKVRALTTPHPCEQNARAVAVVANSGYPVWLASWLQSSAWHSLPVGTKLYTAPVAQAGDGVKPAIAYVEKLRDDYAAEFGSYDPETGVTEFGRAGSEYVDTLETIIEGLTALARTQENG